jgi:hypothetical protein
MEFSRNQERETPIARVYKRLGEGKLFFTNIRLQETKSCVGVLFPRPFL